MTAMGVAGWPLWALSGSSGQQETGFNAPPISVSISDWMP